MKKLILASLFVTLMATPGILFGIQRGRPAVSHPVPIHTPAIVAPHHVVAPVRVAPRVAAPHVVAPRVVAPAVVRPSFVPRPVVTAPVARAPVVVRPPVVVNRPAVVNRPIVVNRPVVGLANRNFGVNQRAYVNRGIYINRGNALYRPGYAYYQNSYGNWHHGYWSGWYQRPWLWFGAGLGAGWLLNSGQGYAYSNPYYTPGGGAGIYDYAQPIQVPAEMPIDPNANAAPPVLTANAINAQKMFEAARQAFLAKDYGNAQKIIDQAIPLLPTDPTLHEFRSLVLFAQQRYQESAATIYAVLAVAPGWDWDTMRALYADPQTYTNQLRALEAYVQANPKNAPARFLLAYHYLEVNARDAAAASLRTVLSLQPSDQLAAHLLQMLEQPQTGQPTPGM